MSKFRSIFILASALIWGIALYGITKIRSDYEFRQIAEPFVINGTIDPPPPPPPPPPPDDAQPHQRIKEHTTFQIPTRTTIVETQERPQIETASAIGTVKLQMSELTGTISEGPQERIPAPPAQKKCKASGPVKLSQYDISDAYPSEALEKELEGSASINVSIDDSGNVSAASVVAATNQAFRSTSVAREAKSLRFKPAIDDDCNPISSSYIINVVFKL